MFSSTSTTITLFISIFFDIFFQGLIQIKSYFHRQQKDVGVEEAAAAVWAFTDICGETAVPYRINPVTFSAFV